MAGRWRGRSFPFRRRAPRRVSGRLGMLFDARHVASSVPLARSDQLGVDECVPGAAVHAPTVRRVAEAHVLLYRLIRRSRRIPKESFGQVVGHRRVDDVGQEDGHHCRRHRTADAGVPFMPSRQQKASPQCTGSSAATGAAARAAVAAFTSSRALWISLASRAYSAAFEASSMGQSLK